MNDTHLGVIAAELELASSQVCAVADLLAQDATVPFIARYRKEATGSLDEIAITTIRDRIKQLEDLDRRKEAVIKSLEQHGHLTDELKAAVLESQTLAVLEDIYLPYRPKRRTKATIAREKGLEPLARMIFEQSGIEPEEAATAYIDPENDVDSIADALSGARDIIAEIVNEDPRARAELRQLFVAKATFQSKVSAGMEIKGAKFKDYFDWQEPAATVPSHRILAMRRGEKEDILNLSIVPPEESALKVLEALFLTGKGRDSAQVNMALIDSYKRLLSRSMETEIRLLTKERADAAAIKVFSDNLRQLLLAAPLGAKRVMGIDPGFRTGCKIVCLDRQGKLLHHDTIYPHLSENQSKKAAVTIRDLCNRFKIEAIAVGNGTAGRETETFIHTIGLAKDLPVVMVNESGASVYSASEVARQEFPDLDLTVRGAISIGRRLMDPLSELVKIDPKSIGVGQYQHDVDPTALKQSLDDVVTSCVNAVGVDVNRASLQLLAYVSGLGPQLAKNILVFRNGNGPFGGRNDLKRVPRLGPKAFEQCAGFLRITAGENPLDASAVHPESYPIVDAMAADLGCAVAELIGNTELCKQVDISKYVTEAVGIPTLNDILAELSKPGRDPRVNFEAFKFAGGIEKITDLKAGMTLPGIVTNVTAFGAFVDIGVHQDGLVHISELADRYVKDPATVVKVNQKVSVTVLSVDLERNRISLSMKTTAGPRDKSLKKRSQTKPKLQKTDPKHRPFNNPFADIFKQ